MKLGLITHSDVSDSESFAVYAQQKTGMIIPLKRDRNIFSKKAQEWMEQNPGTDWKTLCSVVDWAATNKKRPQSLMAFLHWSSNAFKDGFIGGSVQEEWLSSAVEKILDHETDEVWRSRLKDTHGSNALITMVTDWFSVRGKLFQSVLQNDPAWIVAGRRLDLVFTATSTKEKLPQTKKPSAVRIISHSASGPNWKYQDRVLNIDCAPSGQGRKPYIAEPIPGVRLFCNQRGRILSVEILSDEPFGKED